jgi:hypothetical protein
VNGRTSLTVAPFTKKLSGPIKFPSSVRRWEPKDGWINMKGRPMRQGEEVLGELQGEPSGGHLWDNNILHKIRKLYYRLHSRSDVGSWCQQCDTSASRS